MLNICFGSLTFLEIISSKCLCLVFNWPEYTSVLIFSFLLFFRPGAGQHSQTAAGRSCETVETNRVCKSRNTLADELFLSYELHIF